MSKDFENVSPGGIEGGRKGREIPANLLLAPQKPFSRTVSLRDLGTIKIFLPFLLFLAFFFPNTRIEPLNESMFVGRWIALCLIAGIVFLRWFLARSFLFTKFRQEPLTGLEIFFVLVFSWLGNSIIESVNPPVAFMKWFVFLIFLLFCAAYSSLLKKREDLILALCPFFIFFVGFVWLTPISTRYYPQHLLSSMGFINGFLVFTNALGHFLSAFGIPALLFLLTYRLGRGMRIFLIITLFLAVYLTVYSGSRAGTFTSFFIMGLALWRWRRDEGFAFLKVTLFCLGFLFILMNTHIGEYFSRLLYKYPDESVILASRLDFWQRTLDSFHERPVWGFGFGVQKENAGVPLAFYSIGAREQGSTYYGLLEEVGLLGSLPIFLFFGVLAYKCSLNLWRSSDPLDLFFSRVIFVGLGLAAFENYLLSLGNATSILVVLAFFLQERLKRLNREAVLKRALTIPTSKAPALSPIFPGSVLH